MTEKDFERIREFVVAELRDRYSSATVSLWFEPMKIVRLDKTDVDITLPANRLAFVESMYYPAVADAFSAVMGMEMNLKMLSEEEEAEKEEEEPVKESAYKQRFNPEYTFENFVVGKSNKLAQSASVAVSRHPAELNNPLFLYGPSGLGKTHLLFAIMNELRIIFPHYNILYVTGEEFTNELIESLAQKRPMSFREKYRNLDVLLVDDVQFIAGKMSVQEEFFHTFDALYTLKKQIILASDCAPKDINNLEDRLRTRFEMGLVADIQPPDFELRLAIFRRKSSDYNFELSFDVLYYLAENISTNIRQIEGALKKLKAHTLITGEDCTFQVAYSVLSDFLNKARSDQTTIESIFELTEKRYGVTKDDLKSTKRQAEIAVARHYAIYLIRKTTNLSQNAIAKLFNKRDHSTIINSLNFIEKKMKNEPNFDREVRQAVSDLTFE